MMWLLLLMITIITCGSSTIAVGGRSAVGVAVVLVLVDDILTIIVR